MNGLPPDLARLGAHLEAATSRSLRQRMRRRAMANGVGASVLAAPLALALWAAPLAPSVGIPVTARPLETALQPPTIAFSVRHIPDEKLPAPARAACLAAEDCRTPRSPELWPAPPGRV